MLSEVYDRSGRFEEARRALEQAATRSPLDPYNHGCLADVLWKLGQKEEAVARAKRAADLEPGYPWVWDALRRWTTEMGKPEEGLQIARELTAKRAGEARSWLVLARMLAEPDQMTERLAALEKAIELNPRSVDAHEQRVRVLAELERYDEAEAACRPAAFGEDTPIELRGRAAWISARRGNFAGAIEQMRGIVAESPNFYWGWGQLADWHRQSEQKQEWRDTLESMARYWPNEAGVLGRLGEARLANEDRAGAKAALRRAVGLAPDYVWALFELCDLLIQDNELADADRVLALLKSHAPGPHVVEREIELAVRRGDLNLAMERVSALALTPMPSDLWPLKAAIDAIERVGNEKFPPRVRVPVLMLAASDDQIVVPKAVEDLAIRLRAGSQIVLRGSRHEILQERDSIREQFWAAFDAFVPGAAMSKAS
jgi:predicted Zn-dependent protease